jgi:hypothetical protein
MMRIFIYLNDCLLGENTSLELSFLYLRYNGIGKIFKLIKSYFNGNLQELITTMEENLNFNNLFLRTEVRDTINKYIEDYPNCSVNIISNLKKIPLPLLEINDKVQIKIINEKEFKKNIKEINDEIKQLETNSKNTNMPEYILFTGDFFKNIFYFFKSSKTIFVGNYFIGKFVDMLTTGRTLIIHRPYGLLTNFYDYFINFFNNIYVVWPLLFFLPSSNFYMWKYVFLLSNLLIGVSNLLRHLLELENERKALIDNKEVFFGNNFIFLHYSTSMGLILSGFIFFISIIIGCQNIYTFKGLIYAIFYSMVNFIFVGRRNKEFIISKILIIFIMSNIIEPTLIKEWFAIKINN